MPRSRISFGFICVVSGLSAAAGRDATAQSMSAEERNRIELLKKLQLKKAPPKKKTEARASDEADDASENETAADQTKNKLADPATSKLAFGGGVHQTLIKQCSRCHSTGGMAEKSRFILSGNTKADYAQVHRLVTPSRSNSSLILRAARGDGHDAGEFLLPTSRGYQLIRRWIDQGAEEGNSASAQVTVALPAKPAPVVRPPTAATSPTTTTTPVVAPSAVIAAPAVAPAGSDSAAYFETHVHPVLVAKCQGCHLPDKFAGQTRYLVTDNVAAHFEKAFALIVPGAPNQSLLYTKATGHEHGAGAVIKPQSGEGQAISAWIARSVVPPTAVGKSPGPPVQAADVAPPTTVQAGVGHFHKADSWKDRFRWIIKDFQLNGRFDLNYEHGGYHGLPFQGGVDALKSYHHFLFLTRQSPDDPFGFSVELTSLQFWDVNYTYAFARLPLRLSFRLGKLMVPFGADPLFHQSYGGMAGFDQKLLPAIWAQEGFGGKASYQGFRIKGHRINASAELYMVRGYRLNAAQDVLNLQSDFSSTDDLRFGIGQRLGLSWGPLQLWYSSYFNRLGFGRLLFMQAFDVMLWRPRGIAILEKFSAGIGFMRADVSAGDGDLTQPGNDYYHFGSYYQLRYYPQEWLYVQYRQGLRTFDNRGGLYIDTYRLTADDASTHNLSVVARYRGLSAGLSLFWNLEKIDEIENDFLRLTVAYDF